MKIEKINDRQIRCTLTSEDLASREIKISELAYGSEKAKALFHDMMQLAEQDFGFEADNIPLVIEAIPIARDTLIIIITKVEDPEELDTRFSRFAPEDPDGETDLTLPEIEGADDVLDLIRHCIAEARKHAAAHAEKTSSNQKTPSGDGAAANTERAEQEAVQNLARAYSFCSLDDAIRAAAILDGKYSGPNTLYKSTEENAYYLLLKKASSSAEQFNKVCNILSEYAMPCRFSVGLEAYFAEHMDVILADDALHSLKELS